MASTGILRRPRVAQALARYVEAQRGATAPPALDGTTDRRAIVRQARHARAVASMAARDLELSLDEAITSYVELHLYISRLLSQGPEAPAQRGTTGGQ